MNMINVLLKRGVYGTYIYAHDPLLRQTLYQNYQKLILSIIGDTNSFYQYY